MLPVRKRSYGWSATTTRYTGATTTITTTNRTSPSSVERIVHVRITKKLRSCRNALHKTSDKSMNLAWTWWCVMVGVAAVNVTACMYVRRIHAHRIVYRLGLPFVLQCTYRCVFPCDYPSRRTFFDSPLNSVLLQRLMAAVGETCFGLQIAWAFWIVLDNSNAIGFRRDVVLLSCSSLVVFDVIGQHCATYGTVWGELWPFYAEAICWEFVFISGMIASYALIDSSTRHANTLRLSFAAFSLSLWYQMRIYTPECYQRWHSKVVEQAVEANGSRLRIDPFDAWFRREPSREWDSWRMDALWMTPYFSLGAWASLCIATREW